jgi:TRAP-type transport system large permease protein
MENIIILFIIIILLVILGMPIAYSVAVSCLVYFIYLEPNLKNILIINIFSGFDRYELIALPLFILMGQIMNLSGITRVIIDVSLILFGRIRGALALVNVFASMIFGGISGSSIADTGSLGSILIPEMVKRGYSLKDSAGVTVASSTVGMIIPPSIPMILYAVTSSESVGKLFLAGAIPGVLIIFFQLIIVYIIGKKRNWPVETIDMSKKSMVKEILKSLPAFFMPFFIVGVIVLGVATPTEAAGAGVLYATICGFFVYKELKLRKIIIAIKDSIYISASMMVIVAFGLVLGWIFTVEGIPLAIKNIIFTLNCPNQIVLLLFGGCLLLIGTFFDPGVAIIIFTPIFLPAMKAIGIDPIRFGVVMIVGLAVGLVTPPLGGCLNVANKITGMDIVEIFIGSLPWLSANVLVLVLTVFFPQISLFLTQIMD